MVGVEAGGLPLNVITNVVVGKILNNGVFPPVILGDPPDVDRCAEFLDGVMPGVQAVKVLLCSDHIDMTLWGIFPIENPDLVHVELQVSILS